MGVHTYPHADLKCCRDLGLEVKGLNSGLNYSVLRVHVGVSENRGP